MNSKGVLNLSGPFQTILNGFEIINSTTMDRFLLLEKMGKYNETFEIYKFLLIKNWLWSVFYFCFALAVFFWEFFVSLKSFKWIVSISWYEIKNLDFKSNLDRNRLSIFFKIKYKFKMGNRQKNQPYVQKNKSKNVNKRTSFNKHKRQFFF